MLCARRFPLRIASPPWTAKGSIVPRGFAHSSTAPAKQTGGNSGHAHPGNTKGATAASSAETPHTRPAKPSLIEQLFPEETKRDENQQRDTRPVPKLPVDKFVVPSIAPSTKRQKGDEPEKPYSLKRWHEELDAAGATTGVLVLRNASKHLTTEDFRRLIPQGRHIEGWTLQEGDIRKVVPARDLSTLEQQNSYYILFTSPKSAFTYQGHVTRIHRLASVHTPTSNTLQIPPPPGYMIEGLDAHAAIKAFALVPPSQKLDLRKLQEPYTPAVQSIVKFGGYKSIVEREGKLPFEVRLTMQGPQLHANSIRHILRETGKQRNLSWSGGENYDLHVTKWEPQVAPRAADRSEFAEKNAPGLRDDRGSDLSGKQLRKAQLAALEEAANTQAQKRTPGHVFVIGFHTEDAAQSFIAYWHKRRLEPPGRKEVEIEEDLPPVAHVELLW